MKYRPIPSYQIKKKIFSVKSSRTDKLEPEGGDVDDWNHVQK